MPTGPKGKVSIRGESMNQTSHDWEVFAVHSGFVRPTKELDWKAGHYNYDSFSLPPGSMPAFCNNNGLPATAWRPFIFRNPPREFFLEDTFRSMPPLSSWQAIELEKALCVASEPLGEMPFRLFADSKSCVKRGQLLTGGFCRAGW
ncbi:MAG: hypothetical protein KVP17_003458 [Porospora cf. gigantea B]|uniref:uncharacterized protein n=1 Tax=Porospora cf. gigantea B TaxID=2853592 RepID=UPI0035718C29|nr:MAG: hypothetical protein KVP17_003458 [Porospora cf. gigantea B]